MSGPTCVSCKWFYSPPLSGVDRGECGDPTKRIEYKHGGDLNGPPEVWTFTTCPNHQGENEKPPITIKGHTPLSGVLKQLARLEPYTAEEIELAIKCKKKI